MTFTAVGSLLALCFATSSVYGHGYMVAPLGRVVWCREGTGNFPGLWNSPGINIPDPACRSAFNTVYNRPGRSLDDSTFQFQQINEFNGQNLRHVKQPHELAAFMGNSHVCSAGAHENIPPYGDKSGFDVVAPWRLNQLTSVNGMARVEFTFCATQWHNPSEWYIYGTRPGFDPRRNRVEWDRLDLVAEVGNINSIQSSTVVPLCYTFGVPSRTIYRFVVTVPIHELGTYVVMWQRRPESEFFMQCIDYQRQPLRAAGYGNDGHSTIDNGSFSGPVDVYDYPDESSSSSTSSDNCHHSHKEL